MAKHYPLRAVLYLPAGQRGPILRAPGYRPDILVLDLDRVDPPEKSAARALVEAMVQEGALGRIQMVVGIDRLDTLEVSLDLKAAVRPSVRALAIPGVELPGEIRELEAMVQDLERHAGLERGEIDLLPVLESLEALGRAAEIALASPRVVALILGERIAALDPEARGRLASAAASTGVAAIDAPGPKPEDRQGLLEQVRLVREMGYAGKVATRPAQVALIRKAFSTS